MGSAASAGQKRKNECKFQKVSGIVQHLRASHSACRLRRLQESTALRLEQCAGFRHSVTVTDTTSAWEALQHGRLSDVSVLPKTSMTFTRTEDVSKTPSETSSYDIPRHSVKEIENDDLCSICGVYTYGTLHPCHVCTRVYHSSCLRLSYGCEHEQTAAQLNKAIHSSSGWSCHYCDDLSSLLSEEDILTLTHVFDQCDKNQDSTITIAEYINFQKQACKEQTGRCLSPSEEEDEAYKFRLMADHKGDSPAITWWVFLNNEALKLLQKRPKSELLKLLTEKEIRRARETFRFLDRDNNGGVSRSEASEAFNIWYRNFYGDRADQQIVLQNHITTNTRLLMEADTDKTGTVTWTEYLADQALYILAARPNKDTFLR